MWIHHILRILYCVTLFVLVALNFPLYLYFMLCLDGKVHWPLMSLPLTHTHTHSLSLLIQQIKFEGFGIRQGPLHGLPISTPYMTKDYLQLKRFQAQKNGTTYVYDFPEMFRQALEREWEKHLKERGVWCGLCVLVIGFGSG